MLLCSLLCLLFFTCTTADEAPETTSSSEAMLIPDSLPWSERLAQSIMMRHEEAWTTENDAAPEWDYKIGLLMTAFEHLHQSTGKKEYLDYMVEYANTIVDERGQILDYELEEYNIDLINPGKFLFYLNEQTSDPRYLTAIHTLRQQLETHPRTESGGFWHKKIYPYQMWLDGLYMGTPFYTRYTMTFEDGAKLDDIIHQYRLIEEHLRDEATGLYFHGWDESGQMPWADDETGRSPGFWARSMGWYAMAIVDVLDYLPESHPGHQELITYLNGLATALVKVQDDSGLWYQVPDQADGSGNYLEASSSAMFSYALAKGVEKGYLGAEYQQVAERAFTGLTEELARVDEATGEVSIIQICGSAGLGGNPYRDGTYEYYIGEKIKTNNLHGTGPFILAALALKR